MFLDSTWCSADLFNVSTCNDHGNCSSLENRFECSCDKGWKGSRCKIGKVIWNEVRDQSLFSTRRLCSREQRKKQPYWLATNTDDITSQSHSLFACSREKNRQVENGL